MKGTKSSHVKSVIFTSLIMLIEISFGIAIFLNIFSLGILPLILNWKAERDVPTRSSPNWRYYINAKYQ